MLIIKDKGIFTKQTNSNINVYLQNGQIIRKKILYPLGDPENPVTNEAIKEKFLTLTKKTLVSSKANIVIENILQKNFQEIHFFC